LKKVHNFFSKVVEVERRQGGVGEKRGKVRRKMGDFEVEKGLRGGDTARGK
jgi:hypothetical protein